MRTSYKLMYPMTTTYLGQFFWNCQYDHLNIWATKSKKLVLYVISFSLILVYTSPRLNNTSNLVRLGCHRCFRARSCQFYPLYNWLAIQLGFVVPISGFQLLFQISPGFLQTICMCVLLSCHARWRSQTKVWHPTVVILERVVICVDIKRFHHRDPDIDLGSWWANQR